MATTRDGSGREKLPTRLLHSARGFLEGVCLPVVKIVDLVLSNYNARFPAIRSVSQIIRMALITIEVCSLLDSSLPRVSAGG
jgi:hypothetical protein